jgi:hypothetical protein
MCQVYNKCYFNESNVIDSTSERIIREEESTIRNDITNFMQINQSSALEIALNKIDSVKFKPHINPEEAFILIEYFSTGFFKSHSFFDSKNVDQIMNELKKQLYLLKISFYKEEYL